MRIPLNDLKRLDPTLADELRRAADEVIASGWWLNGPKTSAFCEAFAAYLGASHCIGVANGTDALEIALRALLARDPRFAGADANPPEIVTVANAGGYATTAARAVGCAPVFADIAEESQLLAIDSAVAALGERSLAVVATHLYGGLVDVPALRAAMDAAGFAHVAILEDCAQAHGLRGCGGMAGGFGTIATFSFYPTKNLGALGDGGAIVTTDPDLAALVASLRQYGWGRKYEIDRAGGRNSRLDEIQAAFLHAMLPRLDANNARRVAILDAYARALPDHVRLVRSPAGTVGHLAIVMTEDRERLRAHLGESGVATDIHYPVADTDQPGWSALPGRIGPTGIDTTRRSIGRILTVPCFPQMSDDEIAHVSSTLSAYPR
ncbi:DegT/DnrJ/EryC1/StrS family aminotransferase [Enterovirga rhinocerotis]|uniref:dTDP-4-amino-4,6-dideoxygalactose transaminase n=1 Tax=Enterovirga rhinocerotis TaxID=1339210 RepID=A0A4R7C9D0_9HYPH|nr:DegT/DnrJ/EryC1/StrS family aminotransferase [Enterovirga rhinocerotis]TDR95011.1 dTDP-4-amino-4,6-dideoxygalactose transaminase [Enterovirga rhinocerotis]